MPTSLRTLGVRGKNAPTIQKKSVVASDFAIAGLIGQFERKYAKAFPITKEEEMNEIFGLNYSSSYFGYDVANSFLGNLQGVEASLYIKSHVGFNGSVIDAVVANKDQNNSNGLASAITLANSIKSIMNVHSADGVEHTLADTVNFPVVTANCYDLQSLLALTSALMTAFTNHDNDMALALPVYHDAQASANNLLYSAPLSLAECVLALNDLKAKYNAHDNNATGHATGGTHQVATANASTTPAVTMTANSAYKGESDYGQPGNRSGYSITHATRSNTELSAVALATDTSIKVISAINVNVGDLVIIQLTGNGGAIVEKKITLVDESTNTLHFSGALHGSATGVVGDDVSVPGFMIKTYRKDTNGIVNQVNASLGNVVMTNQSDVPEFYFENVQSENGYIKFTNIGVGTLVASFPDATNGIVFLENGADGTSPSISDHWTNDLLAMDNLPIRMIGNCETSNIPTMKAGESYCKSRNDTPIWMAVFPIDQTKSQLKNIGGQYQRSDFVAQVNVAEWVEITDSFNTAPNSPYRQIPNIGCVMGAWIRTIQILGVHYIPCVSQVSLSGIQGIVNANLGENIGDIDRTEIAEFGVNIIQFVVNDGFRIRNFFMPSTNEGDRFANGPLMRNFIKISSQDSLRSSENTPNSFNRIKDDRDAILSFLNKLWDKGSTNGVPVGETFGQQESLTGEVTTPDDHFQVKADAINNPQSSINLGERNIDVAFTYPTPAGSIEIRTAILLR